MKPTLRALLCLTLLACGSVSDPVPSPPEDRGRLLTSGIGVAHLYWSPDGSDVVFLGDMLHVMAAPAAGGPARTLYSSLQSLISLRVVTSGVYVTVRNAGSGFSLVRLPLSGGIPDTIIRQSGTLRSFEFAVSNDGRFVAFGDTLYDRVSATRRVLPAGFAWSFSSDGSLLLWEAATSPFATEMRIIATANMASQTLPQLPPAERHFSTIGVHHWSGSDPHVLHIPYAPGSPGVRPVLVNARTGVARQVASLAAEHGLTVSDVSDDGARVVVWAGPGWTQLHSIDAATGSYEVRATVSRDSTLVNQVRLSPDARQAAYLMYEGRTFGISGVAKLYVVDLGPVQP